MRKSKWALLAVLLGLTVAMSGCFGGGSGIVRQTGGVHGYITVNPGDASITEPDVQIVVRPKGAVDGIALADATVKVAGISTKTQSSGYFRIEGIPVGWHTLTVTHPRYKPYASSEFRVEANKITDVSEEIYGIGYYLIIGVQNYDSVFTKTYPELIEPPLTSPYNDITRVLEWLVDENLLKTDLAVQMFDPTGDEVLTEIAGLARSLRPRDYLVIYFSGHSTGGSINSPRLDALACYDRLVTDGEIRNALLDAGSNDITLILDGCFTGSFADGTPTQPLPKAFLGTPYAILAAAEPDSVAYEIEDSEYGTVGLFTKHLINGLKTREADLPNRDGRITASEIFRYVEPRVKHESYAYSDGTQYVDRYLENNDPVIFTYWR